MRNRKVVKKRRRNQSLRELMIRTAKAHLRVKNPKKTNKYQMASSSNSKEIDKAPENSILIPRGNKKVHKWNLKLMEL